MISLFRKEEEEKLQISTNFIDAPIFTKEQRIQNVANETLSKFPFNFRKQFVL
jgi:hypothetical protein